jgi:hypothetical protein
MQPEITPGIAEALAMVRQNDAIRTTTQAEPLRTLDEWLADPAALEPPKELIPLLVLKGRVTLLAAREKAGKSTLLGQAVATHTRGGMFLGKPCGPGRVIWYAIDEPAPDAVRRLSGQGANGNAVVIQSQRPTPEHIRQHTSEFQPDLVVIDTLTELLADRLQNEREALELLRALAPFMAVFRDTNTAAVLVHHATKDGKDYRGSGQLGAKVDVIANLRIPGANAEIEDDPDVDPEIERRRVLEVRGRGIQGKDRLTWDGEAYQLGEGEMALSARILRAVAEGCRSRNEIATAVGGRRQNVMNVIRQLIEAGQLVEDGKRIRLAAGTSTGTSTNATQKISASAREPLGNHPDVTNGQSGTSAGTDHTQVVPTSGTYTPSTGTTLSVGPGMQPVPWDLYDEAA